MEINTGVITIILIDISQIAIANIMMSPNISKNELDINLIKHMILTSIKNYNQQFRAKYGEIVICCDGRNNWRKKEFKYYKASRKKEKDKSFLDWDLINEAITEMKSDLNKYFPYKVIEVEGAEADDVIAVLGKYSKSDTIIISSDKDYGQLLVNDKVKQYCPRNKTYVNITNPEMHLKELVLRGDRSDGIPNFLSDDDTFVNPSKRQKSITKKNLPDWLNGDIEKMFDKEIVDKYNRNNKLINFEFIPKDIVLEIAKQYASNSNNGSRKTMMDYFTKNKMKQHLLEVRQF